MVLRLFYYLQVDMCGNSDVRTCFNGTRRSLNSITLQLDVALLLRGVHFWILNSIL